MKHLKLDKRSYQYLLSRGIREPMVLKLLREETQRHPDSRMMTPPEQAQFLAWLAGVAGASRILELGTFTGYMSLWFALALPENGRVTTIDIQDQSVAIGRKFWGQAGMLKRIEFLMGSASGYLDGFQENNRFFDLVYVDADKPNYPDYLEKLVPLLPDGGLLIFDNVLWGGKVADPGINDPETEALRTIATRLHKDPRFQTSMIPVGDGLLLCRKR